MTSVLNSITSIVLVLHVVMSIVNNNNNNNNNNDNNNNNNDNNNVSEFDNVFMSMNMNTATATGGNAGRRLKRSLRDFLFKVLGDQDHGLGKGQIDLYQLYKMALLKNLYKCLL